MKKILSLTLAVMMVVSMIPTAFAAEAGGNWAGGTAVSYTADSDANREYSITVPASLAPGTSGTVTLQGFWAGNEIVNVTADKSVLLSNNISPNETDKKTLTVTFDGISLRGNNISEQSTTQTVSVEGMPEDALFGTWSGKFNYQVELVTLMSFKIGGLSTTANENATWADYAANEKNNYYEQDGYIYIESAGTIYQVYLSDVAVNANDAIIAEQNYSLKQAQ